jgi:streptomycin 6-kinase
LPIKIPEKVQRTAETSGEAGRAWLAGLADQVAGLERAWSLSVGEPSPNGTEAFVAEARTEDGQEAMLKIKVPGRDPGRQEFRALRAADGQGYARLLRADETGEAMLLEKLGTQLYDLGLSEEAQMRAISATLLQTWMPQPAGPPFATGAEKAVELAGIIRSLWPEYGEPCSEWVVALALDFAERRRVAFDPEQSVLAHGDAHQWNTLSAPGSPTGFKFIDPDGAFAERAFDLAIPMREWPPAEVAKGDLLRRARKRCRLLSELTGVAPQPIWEWSLVQIVSNGLLLLQISADRLAEAQFTLAEAWTPDC